MGGFQPELGGGRPARIPLLAPSIDHPPRPRICGDQLLEWRGQRGSPLSGGYAGAKATIRFMSSYARAEAERSSLDIRFVSILPQITPATQLGAPFVDAYAKYAGLSIDAYLAQFGVTLTTAQVAEGVLLLATDERYGAPAYLLTADGMSPIE